MIFVISLILSLTFLIFGIVKLKLHPFFVLLMSAVIYGFITGMSPELILQSINDGFGGLLGKIGLIILFGVSLGTILERSGGALVIATKILDAVGRKSIHLAMMLTGYILSIPIFADSALLMLNSLNKVLSDKAKVSYAGTTAALAMGLTASHVMVPPTPGPIAAAGFLEADLGSVIIWGLIVSSLALIPCYVYAKKVAEKINLPIVIEPIANPKRLPSLLASLLTIIIPLILILLKSIVEYPEIDMEASTLKSTIQFLGTPAIALLIGIALTMILPEKLDENIFGQESWIADSLKIAAPIILITGAGGIFGKMLQNSGLEEAIKMIFEGRQLGLLLPFLLAALLKTAQGSSTVALITTATIVAPLMTSLGLDTSFMRTMTVLTIGAGAAVFSHVNDSFFWVLTQLTGMNVKQGYQVQSAGTLIFGSTALVIIFIITQIF